MEGYKVFLGENNKEKGPSLSIHNKNPKDKEAIQEFKKIDHPHMQNFIDCVRTRKWQDLNADILEGYMSSSIGLLGNIAYRVGRTLEFDGRAEKFLNDEEANSYLTRKYRQPFVLPEKI